MCRIEAANDMLTEPGFSTSLKENHMPKQVDTSMLEMALVGYRSQLAEFDEKMQQIRKQLGGARAASNGGGGHIPTPFRTKRVLSAAARKRIAAAQKKRWAAFRAKASGTRKKTAKKRTLSAEAKAKLVANLAKARAARAAKAKTATA